MHSTNKYRRWFGAEQFRSYRSGFTLVELMVVIGLLLLIAVMTASAINTTISGDKVRGGARQVQSFLAGARDRAIYSKAPRGVRFLLEPTTDPTISSRVCRSMVYIAPTDDWTQGAIQMQWDNNGKVTIVQGSDGTGFSATTDWYYLYQQGLLKNGLRMRIPDDSTGEWYTINTSLLTSTNNQLQLTTAYAKSGTTTATPFTAAFQPSEGPSTYRLQLPPGVLPNQEPVLLPKGCVIHLDRCSSPANLEMTGPGNPNAPGTWTRADKLPFVWKRASTTGNPSGFDYTSMMDVMFSPRGTVIGPAAMNGIIHFYIGEQKDADLDDLYWRTTSDSPTSSAPEYSAWGNSMSPGYIRGDKVILTLFTRTGAVSTHPVHPSDTFKFAETGEVAGK